MTIEISTGSTYGDFFAFGLTSVFVDAIIVEMNKKHKND